MSTINPQDGNSMPSTVELIENNPMEREGISFLTWWYRLAAPSVPSAGASLKQRDAFRRGRLISVILLIMIVLMTAVMLTVGIFVNPALFPILLVVLVILTTASVLNRRGYILIAGILVVLGLDLSIIADFLSYSSGLTVFLLPLFDIFVLPELLAVSLLPPKFVFIDACFHILFIVAALALGLLPQSAELKALLHTPAIADALARPVAVQIFVAVVSFLWVSGASQALARADRATVIATLEHTFSEQSRIAVEQKRQLEASIQQIEDVHARVANGDLSARVSLNSDNILWQIAGSLNNLLSRLQRLRQDSSMLKQTNEAIALFFQARERAAGGLVAWQPTGTPIDALVQQHNAKVQASSTAQT